MRQPFYRHFIPDWITVIIRDQAFDFQERTAGQHPNYDRSIYDKWIKEVCINRVYFMSGLGLDEKELEDVGLADSNGPLLQYLVSSFKDERDLTMFILKFGDKLYEVSLPKI